MYVSSFGSFEKKGCKHIYTIAHDMSFVNDIWLWTVCEIMTRFKRREKGHLGVVSRIAICPFVDEINTFVRNRIYIMLQFDNSISIRCNKINLPLNSRHIQGRSQELEMGGAKLLGEGSGGRLRPPVGPGQSPGRGAKGTKLAPRKLYGFKYLINKFPKKSKIEILFIHVVFFFTK